MTNSIVTRIAGNCQKRLMQRLAVCATAVLSIFYFHPHVCTAAEDTIVVALTNEPNSLTSCEHDSLMGVQMNLLTYNGLTRIDMKTLQPVCDLAQSYTQESDTVWVFKLREGVLFHNGDKMTADDVMATIQYAKKFPNSKNYTASMQKIEAVDPLTVRITTFAPNPNLLNDLAYHFNFILPKSLIDSGNDFNANPVGTGPYKFTRWNKGNSIAFEAFDEYFDAERRASIKTLRFVMIPEGTTRTMSLESGEVDFVYDIAPNDIARLLTTDGIAVANVTSVENFFLHLNCVSTPFKDVNLRKAIAYAINREEIIAGALSGHGTPSYSCVSMGYKESSLENAYSFNLNKAKEYMGAWGGDPASVTLDVICSNETKKAIATIMQDELSQIGIKVTVNEMDAASYQAAMTTLNLTAAIVSWSPSNAMTYIQRFQTSRRDAVPSSFADPQTDEPLSKINVCMDEKKRTAMIHDAIGLINDMCPFVPIYQVDYFRAHNANLKNVVCSATGYVDFSVMSW